MGLHRYAAESSGHAQELVKALTTEDVLALAADLKKLGLRAWIGWQTEHKRELHNYVSATPAARAKQAKWREPVLRRRLSLAALVQCNAAHSLLKFLEEHEHMLSGVGPYRDTTAIAGSAYWQIMDTEVQEWPEELELICPSPFLPG